MSINADKNARSLNRYCLAIFVTSWVVRFLLIRIGQPYLAAVNPQEAVLVARSLAAGQGFSNPYGCLTGPTTHLAPVYPFLLSIFYRMFAPGSLREIAIYLFSASITSLAYALLPWLAARLHLDPRAGVAAGFAGALLPLYFWIEVTSEWEAPLAALLIIVTLGLFARLFEQIRLRSAVATGFVCGATLLTFPTALPLLVALSAGLLSHWRTRLAAIAGPVLALWGVALLMVAPWTIRNYRTFHEFIFVRGNAGLELHVSFSDKAGVAFEDTVARGGFVDHPHASPQACAEFARYGEVAMNRRFQKEAEDWVRAHSRRAAGLVLERIGAFWYLVPTEMARSVAAGFVSLVALPGLGLCVKRGLFAGRVLGIAMVVYPLQYYISKFDIRYRYPIYPLLLLLGSVAVMEVWRKFFGPQIHMDAHRSIGGRDSDVSVTANAVPGTHL
jgi:hypothetical protein